MRTNNQYFLLQKITTELEHVIVVAIWSHHPSLEQIVTAWGNKEGTRILAGGVWEDGPIRHEKILKDIPEGA